MDYGSFTDTQAYCRDCDKTWDTKNAHGVGARHAKVYGHEVRVEIRTIVVYEGQSVKKQKEIVPS